MPKEIRRTALRDALRDRLTFEQLAVYPFLCANCSSEIPQMREDRMYCSGLCSQEADWVRYARRCRAEGRDQLPEVIEVLRKRLYMIFSGGYPKSARKLSKSTRSAVFERDQRKCVKCGEPGEEIDHISGSGKGLENLELLCKDCHGQKTFKHTVRITRESHPKEWATRERLKRRGCAEVPLKLCDDAAAWDDMQKELMKMRRDCMTGQGTLFP